MQNERASGRDPKENQDLEDACPFCKRPAAHLWRCPCGFRMCQSCMDENLWGLTCNHVTWTCPDCGRDRSF